MPFGQILFQSKHAFKHINTCEFPRILLYPGWKIRKISWKNPLQSKSNPTRDCTNHFLGGVSFSNIHEIDRNRKVKVFHLFSTFRTVHGGRIGKIISAREGRHEKKGKISEKTFSQQIKNRKLCGVKSDEIKY